MLESLEGGRDLAASFARHPEIFPTLYVSIVSVGEATGTLEKSFLRLTEYLAQEQEMQDRVKGAVRYPDHRDDHDRARGRCSCRRS